MFIAGSSNGRTEAFEAFNLGSTPSPAAEIEAKISRMKHLELKNHIKGSFLKRQYLEAFLVQSAYIESLLKTYADYSYFNSTEKRSYTDKVLNATRESIERFSLNELTKFLHKANLISKDKRDLLNSYREIRNKMMHDLITEIRKDDFEKKLETICEQGNKIIESDEIEKIAKLIDFFDLAEEDRNKILSSSVEINSKDSNGREGEEDTIHKI